MINSNLVAAALGKTIWQTDLFIPTYQPGEMGDWKIKPGGQIINDWGYYSKIHLVMMNPSLLRRNMNENGETHWESWMSLTPHEIESQELGCRFAYEHSVIMGLGMGFVAANIALNQNVKKVTVIELDPDVITLFEQSGALESIPEEARCKIKIVNADALDWIPSKSEPVDFLYADIWLNLANPVALSQIRRMQSNINAATIYYWGQEIAIYNAAQRFLAPDSAMTDAAVRLGVEKIIQLPLLIPPDRDYSAMIDRVIQNRMQRSLSTEVECTELS